MSKGTTGGYWEDRNLPSAFKHALLRNYVPVFGGKTGSRDKRVVYLDGYAGEGRYGSGEEGSAEITLRIAADQLEKPGLVWDCFFAEKEIASVERLRQVAAEYQARGVRSHVHHGEVDGVLDSVISAAAGAPLFLFLDPCGLTLPFERLVQALTGPRSERWPPTELLMNFNMAAVWRLGGHLNSPKGNEKSLQRFEDVCGGSWWREYFAGTPDESVYEEVAAEYALRLARATRMTVVTAPVKKRPHHKQPLYLLVFATRSPHGVWSFGDAAARATEAWWSTLDVDAEEKGMLFSAAERPDPAEVAAKAVPAMAANMERLLQERGGRPFKLIDHPAEVFGEFYGQVTGPTAREAVKFLHRQGKTATTGVGERRVYEIEVRPATG